MFPANSYCVANSLWYCGTQQFGLEKFNFEENAGRRIKLLFFKSSSYFAPVTGLAANSQYSFVDLLIRLPNFPLCNFIIPSLIPHLSVSHFSKPHEVLALIPLYI